MNSIFKKIFALITWKLNRFGDKPHNNINLNKNYFISHSNDLKFILEFLEDTDSKRIFQNCLYYRSTHNIKYQPEYNKKNQYFPQDVVKLSSEEVFIDCGAYTGDTIKTFLKYSNWRYNKIVAFEPSIKNAKKIKELQNSITIINKGVWDKEGCCLFEEAGEGSALIEGNNIVGNSKAQMVECCRLDDCIECRNATFIKMDIEGMELRALMGAKEIIKRNHPKLAICIYHSPEDMVQIALYLEKSYSFYKFFIRHHSHRCAETVLYAIPK